MSVSNKVAFDPSGLLLTERYPMVITSYLRNVWG